jgi:hypothetical protein
MTLPVLQGVGTGSESSCSWPTHEADDWGILPVEHGGGTVATPTDWLPIPGLPLVQSAGSTFSMFMRKATGAAMGAAALSGGTDHMWGVIYTVRGADLTNPIAHIATMIQQGTTTAGIAPGMFTDEDDNLLVGHLAWIIDNAGPLASSWANTALGSVTKQYDAGTATNNGGGITIASGTLVTPGAVPMWSLTLGTTSAFSAVTLAFRPPASSGVPLGRVVNGA